MEGWEELGRGWAGPVPLGGGTRLELELRSPQTYPIALEGTQSGRDTGVRSGVPAQCTFLAHVVGHLKTEAPPVNCLQSPRRFVALKYPIITLGTAFKTLHTQNTPTHAEASAKRSSNSSAL